MHACILLRKVDVVANHTVVSKHDQVRRTRDADARDHLVHRVTMRTLFDLVSTYSRARGTVCVTAEVVFHHRGYLASIRGLT